MEELEGGCACDAVRYRLHAPPLVVHCCHCLNCQRQTGSAFVAARTRSTLWSPASLARLEALKERPPA